MGIRPIDYDVNLMFYFDILGLGPHVRTSSGGSGIKLGTTPGHGWVERGSSQVIRLSIHR